MKGVGEPCAGEPHARFDGRGLETDHTVSPRQSPTQPTSVPPCHSTNAEPLKDPLASALAPLVARSVEGDLAADSVIGFHYVTPAGSVPEPSASVCRNLTSHYKALSLLRPGDSANGHRAQLRFRWARRTDDARFGLPFLKYQ